MIPKRIHYCWLSGEEFPRKMQDCISSWKANLRDYEFVLWDMKKVLESGIEPQGIKWIDQSLAQKNYAFAADYIRLWALWQEGGIYLDTDVEVLREFGDLLKLPRIIGFEGGSRDIEAAVIGAKAGDRLIKKILDSFVEVTLETLPKRMSRVIDGQADILSEEFLSPKNWKTGRLKVTQSTYTIHHFEGSWLKRKERFAQMIGRRFGEWSVPFARYLGCRIFRDR